jgi:hypothetical protein
LSILLNVVSYPAALGRGADPVAGVGAAFDLF